MRIRGRQGGCATARARVQRARVFNLVTTDLVVDNLGAVLPAAGPISLVDDDDFNENDGSYPDGDDGEDVGAPDLSLVQDTFDGARNVFAYAYVIPKYDIGDSNHGVPFVLNTPLGSNVGALLAAAYDFDEIDHEADETFWTVYLLGAYQYQADQDCDPEPDRSVNTEKCTYGAVDDFKGKGASLFMEATRTREWGDRWVTVTQGNASTVAHEIGHLFDARHPELGLMSGGTDQNPTAADALKFKPDTLKKIRDIDHP